MNGSPSRRGDCRRGILTIHDREGDTRAQLVDALPCVERRGDIAADDQEQFALVGAQRLDGIDRVRPSGAVELESRCFESVDTVDRGFDHRETRVARRDHASVLLPRITRDDEQHLIERELVAGRDRGNEMRDVHRIERATEDADALHRASVREPNVNTLLQAQPARPARRNLARVSSYVVRVWLPDRPGALGLVASRIGAIGGDIVGVDVLERSEHVAVDEFAVMLPDGDLVKLLVREIEEVDGASVEECRAVERFPDARLDALESVEQLCAARTTDELLQQLVAAVRDEFAADWTTVARGTERLACAGGEVPAGSVLEALAAGTAASPAVAAGDAGPDDLAIAPLPAHGAVLMVGRGGYPFRRRERRQLLAIARIAESVAGIFDR